MAWLDVTKGWAILWVVYFHSFTCWIKPPSPIESGFFQKVAQPELWTTPFSIFLSLARTLGIGLSQLGFHAVGLFLVASGFVLAQSAMRTITKNGEVRWSSWIMSRLARLYPMYWLAHLIYLISPWEARLEPVDGRFLISLTGLRFLSIDYNFFYLNAAWWYFSLILQLFALFPLLIWAYLRWGPARFLGWPEPALAPGTRQWLLFDPGHAWRWSDAPPGSLAANRPCRERQLQGRVVATGLTDPSGWVLAAGRPN
jgi:peptidoglycan/LPS O-acetylase OafA/YrhL